MFPFFNSIAPIEPKRRLGYLFYTCVRIEIDVRACLIEPNVFYVNNNKKTYNVHRNVYRFSHCIHSLRNQLTR